MCDSVAARGGTMAIEFSCQHCGAVYRLPDRLAGKQVRCKHCREVSVVSAASVPTGSPPPVASAGEGTGGTEAVAVSAASAPTGGIGGTSTQTGAGADASASDVEQGDRAWASDDGSGVNARALTLPPRKAGADASASDARRSRGVLIGTFAAVAAIVLAAGAYFLLPKLRKPTPQPAAITPAPKPPASRHSAAEIAAQGPKYLQCAENMRKLAAAAFDYAERHSGKFPYDLSELAVDRRDGFKAVPAECFFCPSSGTKVPPDMKAGELANWLHKHTDYVWVARRRRLATHPAHSAAREASRKIG